MVVFRSFFECQQIMHPNAFVISIDLFAYPLCVVLCDSFLFLNDFLWLLLSLFIGAFISSWFIGPTWTPRLLNNCILGSYPMGHHSFLLQVVSSR